MSMVVFLVCYQTGDYKLLFKILDMQTIKPKDQKSFLNELILL